MKLPEAVFPPIDLQWGSSVRRVHVKCGDWRLFLVHRGLLGGIHWAWSVSHSSQLSFSH